MTKRNELLAGLCVLVAEDEYLIAREMRRVLINNGCAQVQLAASLADAERIADAGGLHAALLDIKLGEQDAFSLAGRLEREGVPMLFISGYTTEVLPAHLAHVPLVQKPFPHGRLLATLQSVLSGRKHE